MPRTDGLIVLDGPDGTGKTTLADHLVASHGARYLHLTYRFPDKMDLYHVAALRQCLRWVDQGYLVVLDRWWPSELLYAAEFRGGSKWPQWPRLLDRLAIRHGTVYVYCLPHKMSTWQQRFEKLKTERKEYYDNVLGVARRYEHLFYGLGRGARLPADYASDLIRQGGVGRRADTLKYRLEVEGQDLKIFSDVLLGRLRGLRAFMPLWQRRSDFKNLLGNPTPRTQLIFVGDQPNIKSEKLSYPFFEAGNCSGYLLDHVHLLNLDETRCVWLNVNDNRHDLGANILISCLDRAPLARVVVLGELAKKTVDALPYKTKYTFMQHPQWYRRFHHNDGLFLRDLRKAVHHARHVSE